LWLAEGWLWLVER